MSKTKVKDAKFYTELVFTTILSLVAASLWIEWIKGFISRHFDGNPGALMGMAMAITLLAIFCLQLMFTSAPKEAEAKSREDFHQGVAPNPTETYRRED